MFTGSDEAMFVEHKSDGEVLEARPSLKGFIGWLERQPAERRYNWRDPRKCACGQYAAALGIRGDWLTSCGDPYDPHNDTWRLLNHIAFGRGHLFHRQDWTFGEALKRARRNKPLWRSWLRSVYLERA